MVSLGETALDGAQLTLLYLRTKVATGATLTSTDKLCAMTAAAVQERDRYGPGPGDMELTSLPLPESVKGAIANACS